MGARPYTYGYCCTVTLSHGALVVPLVSKHQVILAAGCRLVMACLLHLSGGQSLLSRPGKAPRQGVILQPNFAVDVEALVP